MGLLDQGSNHPLLSEIIHLRIVVKIPKYIKMFKINKFRFNILF